MIAGLSSQRRLGYFALLVFYVFFAVLTFVIDSIKVTEKMDRLIYDNWVRLSQAPPDNDIVIVGIDSHSTGRNGRWPWSRIDQAKIIEHITAAGARVIVTDILYVDRDMQNPDADRIFAQAVEASGRVILPVITEGRGSDPALAERLPLSEFSMAAHKLGHVFMPIDSDGIVRRALLRAGYKQAHWDILSVAAMEALQVKPEPLPGRRIINDDRSLVWRGDYEILIPFHGPKNSFRSIAAVDVLKNTFDHSIIEGSIVFLGLTATGLGDAIPTPISGTDQPMPGVEVHATIYSALRSGSIVTRTGTWPAYVIVFVSIALLLAVYTRLRPRWGLICTVAFALFPVLLSYALYRLVNVWFAPLLAALPVLLAFPLWSWHRLEFAGRFLRSETNKLARYDDDIGLTSQLPINNLFVQAMTHLGLKRWFVQFEEIELHGVGSTGVLDVSKISNSEWTDKDGFRVKKYLGVARVIVGFDFGADHDLKLEFGKFIDNASRLQRIIEAPYKGGTIESLQNDADRLSKQTQRILQLNVLSDSIFNGSPAGLIVWNSLGEIMRYNDLAKTMFSGTALKELSVRDFISLIGKDPSRVDREAFEGLMKHGQSWQVNIVKGAKELVVDINVHGDELADRLIVASAVDLSEIRSAERLRSELIEYLSHDLRSPLISSLYLVSQRREDGVEADNGELLQIESNINKSLKMIDDLLGLTRAENLQIDQLQPIYFENIIENTIDQLSPQARQKEISLRTDNVEDDVWISADSSLLERAFVNVVGNAIKYSDRGTKVSVAVKIDSINNEIVSEITDQGIGIPAERIGMLFERFHRDPQAQQQYSGTGLGLALVARVIQQHGGIVTARSVENEGTTIEIRLPILEIEQEYDSLSA